VGILEQSCRLGETQEDLDFVNRYETDFKPVVGRALQLLKDKGRKSAQFIIRKYLSHLI
jgi:hypothetical protein